MKVCIALLAASLIHVITIYPYFQTTFILLLPLSPRTAFFPSVNLVQQHHLTTYLPSILSTSAFLCRRAGNNSPQLYSTDHSHPIPSIACMFISGGCIFIESLGETTYSVTSTVLNLYTIDSTHHCIHNLPGTCDFLGCAEDWFPRHSLRLRADGFLDSAWLIAGV
jgi:hypothetical protein